MTESPIVLFDGVCNLCNGFVNFVISRDQKAHFRFGSLQSSAVTQILAAYGGNFISSDAMTTVILLQDKKIYTRSEAVLKIFRGMDAGWPILYGFIIVPAFIRDFVYSIFSKYRYRWFGKREQCRVPTPKLKARFIA